VTAAPPASETDRLSPEAYVRMTQVLRAGLVLSLAILTGTLIAYLIAHPSASSQSVLASNPILQYLSVLGLVHGLATGRREAYLTLGLLVLLATPVLRVLTGVYYFRRDGERVMAAVTATVFVLLLVGLFVIGPYLP
jgi:uncharacterized membrane protein